MWLFVEEGDIYGYIVFFPPCKEKVHFLWHVSGFFFQGCGMTVLGAGHGASMGEVVF